MTGEVRGCTHGTYTASPLPLGTGNGRSFSHRSWTKDYHLEDAQMLVLLLRRLNLHSVTLVGNSDGCPIALLTAGDPH